MASQKQIASAIRNADKLAAALERKQQRSKKTTERMNHRLCLAEDALSRAEASLLKAQQRVEKTKAKLDAVREESCKLGEKRMKEVDEATERAAEAKSKADKLAASPQKTVAIGGTVETETGEARPISKKAADIISKLVGKKKKGTFQPLDGKEAQSILDALEASGNVGDIFTVTLKGRKAPVMFSVEKDGLAFAVVSAVCVSR